MMEMGSPTSSFPEKGYEEEEETGRGQCDA